MHLKWNCGRRLVQVDASGAQENGREVITLVFSAQNTDQEKLLKTGDRFLQSKSQLAILSLIAMQYLKRSLLKVAIF